MKVSSSNFVRYFQFLEFSIWMMKPISVAKRYIFDVFLSKALKCEISLLHFVKYFQFLKLWRLTKVQVWPLVKINHFAPCNNFLQAASFLIFVTYFQFLKSPRSCLLLLVSELIQIFLKWPLRTVCTVAKMFNSEQNLLGDAEH